MGNMHFNLLHWAATSPGLVTNSDWLGWANNNQWPIDPEKPPVDRIPAMMRRRLSSLSKLAIQTAITVSDEQAIDYIVFASRHGELTRTVSLLESILRGDDASPMAFSQSVHNTASGLFTIAAKLTTSVTSIASCDETFHSALIDSIAYLHQNPSHKVLVVNFDEPLPSRYAEFETHDYQGYAIGMIIESGDQFTFTREPKVLTTKQDVSIDSSLDTQYPDGLQFLYNMLKSPKQWNIETNRSYYRWLQVDEK